MEKVVIVLLSTLLCFTFWNSELKADDNNPNSHKYNSEEIITLDGENLIIMSETLVYDGYIIKTVEDSHGNRSVYDSRYDYVVENGEKIYFDEVFEKDFLSGNANINNYSASNWRFIRTWQSKVTFDKAISDLAITTIAAKIPVIGKYKIAASIAKTIYDAYVAKPDLKLSNAFYNVHDIYGYIFTQSREGEKQYQKDSKGRIINGTTQYSDPDMKGL